MYQPNFIFTLGHLEIDVAQIHFCLICHVASEKGKMLINDKNTTIFLTLNCSESDSHENPNMLPSVLTSRKNFVNHLQAKMTTSV